MKIQKIHITDFKCIEDLTVDFENITGFWEIEGETGSGKTTIGEAILYGLFGSVRQKNNASLISWGKKHAMVEIWAISKNKNLYINRKLNAHGQSPLSVTVDGQPIIFTNKRDAQSQLETEYYDTSRLMLETLCIISFNGFKSLSSLNAKEISDFSDQAFGFNILTEYANLCLEGAKSSGKFLSKYGTESYAIKRQIDGVKEWQSKDEHITQNVVDEVQSEIDSYNNQYKDIIKTSTDKLNKLSEEYNKIKTDLTVVKTKGSNVKKNIDFISKGICPTCGHPLDQSHLEEHKKERDLLLTQYKELNDSLSKISEEISLCEKEKNELSKPIIEKIQQLNDKLRHFQDQIAQQKRWNSEITKLEDELKQNIARLDEAQLDFDQWNELHKLLSRNIRDNVLASIVPSINSNIQSYILRLRQPYIVEFDESFSCHIKVTNMDESIPISSLSTGQLKVVDMIITLSILKTLLTNVQFNVIFLDELVSNMHEELRDMMCDMLRDNMFEGQTMFIISHAPLKKEYFDGRIKVNRTNILSSYTFEPF